MQTPRLSGCERRYATFINLPAPCTKVSKAWWKEGPRAFVSFAFEPPRTLIHFDPAPLSPEILGVTNLENTTISDAHTGSTAMPPPNAHISSSSQPTSQQPNHPVTPAMTTQHSTRNAISIPKGPVPPGSLSTPAVVGAPYSKYASPIDDSHLPQHQYQAHRALKRISTVPIATNGPYAQGHIMNDIHATTHQIPHQIPVNRIPPMSTSQPPQPQPQATNRLVSSADPTPQPAPIAIQSICGNPIADSIFSGTSD